MRTLIISILIFSFCGILNAQQRDLNFYLEQAKSNSPLINKSENEKRIIDLDLEQVKRVLSKPEINLEANILFAPIISHDNNSNNFKWVSENATNYSGYDLAVTDGGQHQAFISLKQPIFTKLFYQNYFNKAENSRQINNNQIELTIHEIDQLVGYQYILCLKSKIQTENSLSLIKQIDEQLLVLNKLVENAIYKLTDLMILQIEYQNYQLDLKTNQEEFKNNLFDLNLICGINDTSFVDIQELDLQLKPALIENSKFLNSYKLDSLNVAMDQSISELKYKPQLNWFANAGLNAVYLPSFNRLGFSTGLTFIWNLYDGKQRKIERDKSAIKLENIQFEKKNFITQNNINKNKINNQLTALDERLKIIENQISQYNQLYNAYQKELSLGEISVIDFKNLLKDIAAKKQESLLLKMDKQILINSYNYWNY